MEDDFLLEDEDDQKTIEFIKNYLPQDLKDKFTEDDLYYILDVIVDYYTSSGWGLMSPMMYSLWFKGKWNMEIHWDR